MRSKIIIFSAIIFSIFFFCNTAKANIEVSNEQATTTNYLFWGDGWKVAGQRFVATKNNIKQLAIGNFIASTTISICAGIPNNSSQADVEANAPDCNWADNILLYKVELKAETIGEFANRYVLPLAVSLTVGNDYYFVIDMRPNAGADGNNPAYDSAGTGAIINGNKWTPGLTYALFYDTTIYDILYNLYNIEMITPSPNWIYSKMPAMMTFRYMNFLGYYKIAKFKIFQLSGKGGSPVLQITNFGDEVSTTTQQKIGGAQIYLNPGYYQLYDAHFLTKEETNYITTPINFQVIATGTPLFGNASTSLSEMVEQISATVCDGIETSTGMTDLHIFGDIECGLKKAGLWLFKPSDSSIEAMLSSFIEFKQAFPFNAFFGITDAFQSGISTTTEMTTFKIPFITATGTITTLPVMSSTSLSNLIGTNNNNLFRQSIIYFAWIICAMIIYITVRKI